MIPTLSPHIRFLLAIAIWLLPGWALARVLFAGRDPLARVSFAAAAGVAASVLLVTAAYFLRVSARDFHLVLYGAAGVAAIHLLLTARRKRPESAAADEDRRGPPESTTDDDRPGPFTRALGWGSLLFFAVAGGYGGATMRYSADGPDHVGTIREILASGSFLPTEAFHVGAGLLGADPRKGLLHPVYAALAAMSGIDPVDLWGMLPLVAAPFLFGMGYLLLRGLRVRPSWSVPGAWLLLLTWNNGTFATSPYPNQFGEAMFWAAAGALLLALEQRGFSRALGAALLLFGTVAVHAQYAVFFVFFGALVLASVLVVRRAPRAEVSFLVLTAGLAAIPLVPYLFVRQGMFSPTNTIHTELQGMLLLGDGRFVADPLRLWRYAGLLGLVAYPLGIITLARRWRADRVAFLVFWSAILVLLLTLNPWLVPVLQRRFTYLIFRFIWFLPPAVVALAILADLGRRGAECSRRSRVVVVALLALACIPAVRTALPPRWLVMPVRRAEARVSPLRWRAGLEGIARRIPPRSVVLSDPVTSYVLPAFTGLKVAANLDMHSSPNDSLAITRIAHARDVLSPAISPLEAATLTRQAGAGYVLINERFPAPLLTFYMGIDPEALAQRERDFEASGAWELLARENGFALFRPRSGAVDTLVEPWAAPIDSGPAGPALARGVGLALLTADAERRQVTRGDSLAVDLHWTLAGGPVQPAHRMASLRLDAMDGVAGGFPGGKLGRKIRERIRGVLYRCRVDWIPGAGVGRSALPPARWRPGEVIRDRVVLHVPATLAPGAYAVSVGVACFASKPNYTLADLFTDQDLYAGTPVDTITVVN